MITDKKNILFNYLLALSPIVFCAIYFFKLNTLRLIGCCVISSVLIDIASNMVLRKKPFSTFMESAVVGLLFSLCLPPALDCIYAVIGIFISIVITRKLFEGKENIVPFNSVLFGRVFLLLSFTTAMSKWTESSWNVSAGDIALTTTATPLDCMNARMASYLQFDWSSNDLLIDIFFGNRNGCLGEISSFAIIIGGVFLLLSRTVSWRIPISFLLTSFIFAWLAPTGSVPPIINLLSGSLLFSAFFLAGDRQSSPSHPFGQIIFGFGCGLLTMIIRSSSSSIYPEGAAFAILVMNALVPLIDKFSNKFFTRGAA
ncbi:MAG: RnfABCDGE type electron transport complex subunit D [Kiritimatiellae bacterium]|nr:RnfABCDGE type electron transport complex subunit D [Kiritimatiellia bacterium]